MFSVGTDGEAPILAEVSKYLDWAGISQPFSKIFITSEPLDQFPLIIALMVLSQLPKFVWGPRMSSFVSKDKKDFLDGPPFVVGIITVLKQFHSSHSLTFLGYLAQYIRGHVVAAFSK